jgi:uncharacterized protein
MRTVRIIKEPIHNYIALSELENRLINDPLFLRLQYISQNGLAYLTYPSNRTSRFIHSLGTMHIGGEMILSALRTSERDLRGAFLNSFSRIARDAAKESSIDIVKVKRLVSKKNDIFYMHNGFDPKDSHIFFEILLFQAVRIASVVHDLGHPPFSHAVETVLKSSLESLEVQRKAPEEYQRFGKALGDLNRAQPGQLHERIGRALTLLVFTEVADDYEDFGKLCFWIAERIATPELASQDPDGIIACLHSIVSGDTFDADRCDYVLRDGYASGFEFGEYDLTRILQNLRLSKNNQDRFEIVSTTTAASALESFFLERYRIWRWVVFHPNVVRAEIALARAMAHLLDIALADRLFTEQERTVRRILNEWDFQKFWRSFESKALYRQYVSCDEPWMIAMFREIQSSDDLSGMSPRRIAMLKTYLDFILDRKKLSFQALWKRAEEYEEFALAVKKTAQDFGDTLAKLDLLPSNRPATEWLNQLIQAVLKADLRHGQVNCMRRLEDKLQEKLHTHGFSGAILASVLKFSAYSECFVADKAGKKVPLSNVSSVVQNIPSTWKKDIQFRGYWVGLHEKRGAFRLSAGSKAPSRENLAQIFLSVLLDVGEWRSLKSVLKS